MGQYSGNYSINSYTEASGAVGLIERYQTGIAAFRNSDWDTGIKNGVFIYHCYQITSQDQLTDPVGRFR